MLTYEAELNLLRNMLSQFNLKVTLVIAEKEEITKSDLGLRSRIYGEKLPESLEETLNKNFRDKVIYKIKDEFSCCFALILLPEFEKKTILVIGPYLKEEHNEAWIEHFIEVNGISHDWIHILENYFSSTPFIPNDMVITAALNSLAERIWGIHQFSTEEIISGVPERFIPISAPLQPQIQDDILSSVRRIEQSYYAENQLIEAVSQGRSHRASIMLSNFSHAALEKRTTPIRNIKNYSIILNTILRKAVESGGVHPLHIDRVSSEFAIKIENITSLDEINDLWQDMVKKYCLLVKNHATTNYSRLVQYIIARVDFDLTADLSLKANAAALNVNASYLSSLFKKETGKTITNYVNQKRVEHAIYLLCSTDLPISVVGQRCGIPDDNYFTKIFKKYTAVTPKQYRWQNGGFGNVK
ncbi:MAG: helix-turn-helix domain-containing protein [Clostridia bacterium]|nr:helix-turn-helix domain-containing protein [Clostridia bacterium]